MSTIVKDRNKISRLTGRRQTLPTPVRGRKRMSHPADDASSQFHGSLPVALHGPVRRLPDTGTADAIAREVRLVAARESSLLQKIYALEAKNSAQIIEIDFLSESLRNANRVLRNHWDSRLWIAYRLYRRIRRRR